MNLDRNLFFAISWLKNIKQFQENFVSLAISSIERKLPKARGNERHKKNYTKLQKVESEWLEDVNFFGTHKWKMLKMTPEGHE